MDIRQQPPPGQSLLAFAGHVLRFTLEAGPHARGRAYLRTNLGHGAVTHREIVRMVENNEQPQARGLV